MRLTVLALLALLLAPGPAGAEQPSIDSAAHLAMIEGLPAERADLQEQHRQALEGDDTAALQQAQAAIIEWLGGAWLDLAAVWPEDHFGTADHAQYLDTFVLSRAAFYRAINRFDDAEPDASLIGVIVTSRLLKDLDQFVADTATAQLSYHDPVASLDWLGEWQAAAR